MCGRFTLTHPPKDVRARFHLDEDPPLEPRYNIAPTQQVFVVRGANGGAFLKWGLVPAWAGDVSIGTRLLNARAETVAEKPAFRAAFHRRRCLIPADGFYEWLTMGRKKQPIHFRFRDGRLFAMAGLWERWEAPGSVLETCTVITTVANTVVRPAHDRMPAILDPSHYSGWLDPDNTRTEELGSWLTDWLAEDMTSAPANPVVNNVRNEGPACLDAIEAIGGRQQLLF